MIFFIFLLLDQILALQTIGDYYYATASCDNGFNQVISYTASNDSLSSIRIDCGNTKYILGRQTSDQPVTLDLTTVSSSEINSILTGVAFLTNSSEFLWKAIRNIHAIIKYNPNSNDVIEKLVFDTYTENGRQSKSFGNNQFDFVEIDCSGPIQAISAFQPSLKALQVKCDGNMHNVPEGYTGTFTYFNNNELNSLLVRTSPAGIYDIQANANNANLRGPFKKLVTILKQDKIVSIGAE